jgi:hypothetical protein
MPEADGEQLAEPHSEIDSGSLARAVQLDNIKLAAM